MFVLKLAEREAENVTDVLPSLFGGRGNHPFHLGVFHGSLHGPEYEPIFPLNKQRLLT